MESLGTNADSSKNMDFCRHCFKDGEFTVNLPMEEMISRWKKYLHEFNRYSNDPLTEEQVVALLRDKLPQLKRWRQKSATNDVYQEAVNQVQVFINEHLFDPLDVKTLSQVAGLSEFHFHRIFRSIIGENIGEYIIRLRLECIAHKLSSTRLTLTQLAGQTTYQSKFALSKAFRKHFGVSPSQYRVQPKSYPSRIRQEPFHALDLNPEIRRIEHLKVVYYPIGNACHSAAAYKNMWLKMTAFVDGNHLADKDSRYMSISLDDPLITPPEHCRFYICMTTKVAVKPSGKFGRMGIPDGDYAVFRWEGAYTGLHTLYRNIYLNWLPKSGYQLSNTISFEVYLNTPDQVAPSELVTEVYIPVEQGQ